MNIKRKIFRLIFPQEARELVYLDKELQDYKVRLATAFEEGNKRRSIILGKDREISEFKEMASNLRELTIRLQTSRDSIKKNLKEVSEKYQTLLATRPSMADLMRQNLGTYKVNFSNVDKQGKPYDFLDEERIGKDTRLTFISQLAQIWGLEAFQAMCNYHIDAQGNFSFREADGEVQILAGRMTVNGISLIRNEVKEAFEEYMDKHTPQEDEEDEDEGGEKKTTTDIIIDSVIKDI
jgi:hypothetical protein